MATRFRLDALLEAARPPLSQAELARRAGVSPTTVNTMVLNRATRVDLATLDAISRVIGCTPGDLFEQTPDIEYAQVAEPKKPYGPRKPAKKRKR